MKRYEVLEHTADIRVKIFAESEKDLFENSAVCLFELLTDNKAEAQKTRKIELTAANLEDLLILWLNELISVFYSYKFLPAEYKILVEEISGAKKLTASIIGAEFNPYADKNIKSEVKAATYHNLKINKDKAKITAEIIFDV
jgi:SHS2 domain-containing protein